MRRRIEEVLGIAEPTPGRVFYDPRYDDRESPDMRARRIPPQIGSPDERLGDAIP